MWLFGFCLRYQQGGPMTIAVNSKFFDNYKKGIMSPKAEKCKGNSNSLDHQILIVGYGEARRENYIPAV